MAAAAVYERHICSHNFPLNGSASLIPDARGGRLTATTSGLLFSVGIIRELLDEQLTADKWHINYHS